MIRTYQKDIRGSLSGAQLSKSTTTWHPNNVIEDYKSLNKEGIHETLLTEANKQINKGRTTFLAVKE